jgi:hypothetical protein
VADETSRAARLMARAHDPLRHPGHRDGEFDLSASRPCSFLDLPGPRWRYGSDGAAEDSEWPELCRRIEHWRAAALPPLQKQ